MRDIISLLEASSTHEHDGYAGLASPYVPMYEQQHPADWTHIIGDSAASILFVSKRALVEKVALAGLWFHILSITVKQWKKNQI